MRPTEEGASRSSSLVTAVTPVTPAVPTDAAASTDVPAPPPGGSGAFAAALRAVDVRSLPSVGLATMVAARAGVSPAAAAASPVAPASASASSIGAPAAAPVAAAGGGAGAAVLRAGERYLGVPYKWGGTDPAVGLDCSGFTQRAFADIGVSLPRVSVDQAKVGTAVPSLAEAQPGDLVFWRGNGNRPNHIGIYAGDGQMLVAPRTGDVVKYQAITRPPDGIRRVV